MEMNRRELGLVAGPLAGGYWFSSQHAVDYAPTVYRYSDLVDSYPLDYFPGPRSLHESSRCVHCSVQHILAASGEYREARRWRYDGGEYSSRLASRLDSRGISFAVTTTGDVKFLDWVAGNLGGAHRMAAVTLLGAHVLNMVALDPEGSSDPKAYWLNNWHPASGHGYDRKFAETASRKWFIDDWRRRGGWAFTLLSIRGADGKERKIAPPIPRPVISDDSIFTGEVL